MKVQVSVVRVIIDNYHKNDKGCNRALNPLKLDEHVLEKNGLHGWASCHLDLFTGADF